MSLLDSFFIHYLNRFDKCCFNVKLHDKIYTIGEGKPVFTAVVNKDIPKKELLASTSLALGEAYMRGDIEIEGDLFTALKNLLSQMSQFSLDKSALGSLLHTSESKANQKKQVSSHYDLGNDFYKLWLDPSMSLVTSAKIVGRTKLPLAKSPIIFSPPHTRRAPSCLPISM